MNKSNKTDREREEQIAKSISEYVEERHRPDIVAGLVFGLFVIIFLFFLGLWYDVLTINVFTLLVGLILGYLLSMMQKYGP